MRPPPSHESAVERGYAVSDTRIAELLTRGDGIFRSRDARPNGVDHSMLRRAIDSGELVRPARALYVAKSLWKNIYPSQRHRILVEAAAYDDPEIIFGYQSAAAIHGLPRIDRWDAAPHTISGGRINRGRKRGTVVVHREEAGSDIENREGILVTNTVRTVVDIARSDSLWSTLAVADYSVRKKLVDASTLQTQLSSMTGRHRIARAREFLSFVNGKSESPGESWSRTQMILEGIQLPILQQKFADRWGLIGRSDFFWKSEGVIGEFDGYIKYQDPKLLAGRDPTEVMIEEKEREDRLRRAGFKVIRWVWRDLQEVGKLREILLDAGIPLARTSGFINNVRHSPHPRSKQPRWL